MKTQTKNQKLDSVRPIVRQCIVGLCLAWLVAATPMNASVVVTNATVDLSAAPPTVTFSNFDGDSFGDVPGEVYQAVDGVATPLAIVSWTTETVVAELASSSPGDYITVVQPVDQPLAFFTLTVPDPDLPSVKAALCDALDALGIEDPAFCPETCTRGDRYEDQGDGTVLDCNTGIVWLKDASCAELVGADAEGRADWATAVAAAATLADGTCGLTDGSIAGDWRLPDLLEVCGQRGYPQDPETCLAQYATNGLIDSSVGPPTVINAAGISGWTEADPFTGVQSDIYWTSTYDGRHGPNQAWSASLVDGFLDVSSDASSFFIWPIRADP